MERPIIAFFVVIWLIGVIGNALKGKQKAKELSEAKTHTTPHLASQPTQVARTDTGVSAAGSIAGRAVGGSKPGAVVGGMGTGQQKKLQSQRQAPASMRGQDRQVIPATQPAPVAKPAAKTPDQVAREMRRILGLESEPPQPVAAPAQPAPPPMRSQPVMNDAASVQLSKSPSRAREHVSSHVGEGMRDRQMAATKVGQTTRKPSARGEIGNLGGRNKPRKKHAVDYIRRYPMTDLRRMIVMSELLSPPVTMRPDNHRLF
ncbi:MAG: hypothetical protein ACI91B_001978 [Planctomycetota bacterium]|jgi:hypothetical protein